MFKRLHIKQWRQFSDVEIFFHEHLTVLTGANGAGKTTLLNLLSKSTGWEPQFVSSYEKNSEGLSHYFNSFLGKLSAIISSSMKSLSPFSSPSQDVLGELEFSDGATANFILPNKVSSGTYSITIQNGRKEKGVYINSHRPSFPYKAIKSIPTTVATRENIYGRYEKFNKSFTFDTYRNADELSATALIKETLASLAIFGYGNPSVKSNETAKSLFEGYVNILKIILPPKLGFTGISVDIPEVIVHTKTGDFPIDAVSGGISSIINITWQLYMFADPSESFVALIDEPENHLHPELQKSFLGNLIKAFPHVQFIVATHNPFIISAVKDSNVYVLDYNEEHKVFSKKLDYINRAGTSNAILREVLGIETTIPFWAEDQLKDIVKKYLTKEFSQQNLESLRCELEQLGLSDFIPETIAQIAEGIADD